MAEERVQRRLAAILVADVVGYSGLMGVDEEGTLAALTAHLTELIEPCIADYRGRVFKTTGDGFLSDFASVVDAVQCALAFQAGIIERNSGIPNDHRIEFRVGINMGDVIVQNDDMFGDGVNIAARLEGLAEPGGICISDTVYQNVRSKIELSFDDLGPQQAKNIGEPVRAFLVRPEAKSHPTPELLETPPLPEKPSIAVLPFENMSADAEQEYFSDGITEDIITDLSKISGLFVIARHSAFTYKGLSVTLKQVGRELGVRYVLEGSVRRGGNRLRITAQLIDATTDHHLWAERFDRDIEDMFAVQDEVSQKVVEALEVALTPGETKRIARVPTTNLEAYDVYLRARRTPYPPTRHNIRSARSMYERVIEMDPNFAGGYAGKSSMHSMAVHYRQSDDRERDAAVAFEMAQKAVTLDPDFADSHAALGYAYLASGRYKEAVVAAKRAVDLRPGDAETHHYLSRCLVWAGSPDEAYEELLIAIRLDPQNVAGPYLPALGRTAFAAGRFDAAREAYERNSAQGGPSYLGNLVMWSAACVLTGNLEKAQALVQEMLQEKPDLCLGNLPDVRNYASQLELEQVSESLRKAGLPE